MPHASGLQFLHLEDGKKLVLAEFEKRVALAAIQFLEIENVFVKRDRLLDVVHFDRDMIRSINLHAHTASLLERSRAPHFLRRPRSK